MPSSLYTIVDEPTPSRLSQLAVKPLWPLLGMMLGGAWVGLPWFAFNGFALGSPTRVREAVLAACGSLGSAALFLGVIAVKRGLLHGGLSYSQAEISYIYLMVTVWKLSMGYWIQNLQGRSASLHAHFGGQLRNGAFVVIAASVASRSLLFGHFLKGLPDALYLAIC